MIVEKAVEVHLPDARPAELALVQDCQQERCEEGHGRVPEIDRAHFPARDVQRQALFDRGEQRFERRLQVARAHAVVVEPFGQPYDVRADPAHVLQAERRAVQHLADRVLERVLGRGDERPVARRLPALPDEVRLHDAFPILEVVPQRGDADASGAGHLPEAGADPG